LQKVQLRFVISQLQHGTLQRKKDGPFRHPLLKTFQGRPSPGGPFFMSVRRQVTGTSNGDARFDRFDV
jgi:hypothetical protein